MLRRMIVCTAVLLTAGSLWLAGISSAQDDTDQPEKKSTVRQKKTTDADDDGGTTKKATGRDKKKQADDDDDTGTTGTEKKGTGRDKKKGSDDDDGVTEKKVRDKKKTDIDDDDVIEKKKIRDKKTDVDDDGDKKTTAGGKKGQQVTDKMFVMKASESDLAEINTSRLAERMAASPQVKMFAQHMVRDHAKASQELLQIANRKGLHPAETMSKKHKMMYDKLTGLEGADFDREYMNGQVKAHEEAVQLFESASGNLQDEDLRNFAERTLPIVQGHLKMARQIANQADGGGAKGGGAKGGKKKAADPDDDDRDR